MNNNKAKIQAVEDALDNTTPLERYHTAMDALAVKRAEVSQAKIESKERKIFTLLLDEQKHCRHIYDAGHCKKCGISLGVKEKS